MLDEKLLCLFKRRVVETAKYIDTVVPNWNKYIDAEILDMNSTEDCICGQIQRALEITDRILKNGYGLDAFNNHQGFFVEGYEVPYGSPERHEANAFLRVAWTEEVQRRNEQPTTAA